MKRILILTLALVLLLGVAATPVMADKGDKKAGGGNSPWWFDDYGVTYIGPADLYIGPDCYYGPGGAGSTETWCSDGTYIPVIVDAFLWAKGHYFSDEAFTEKDWVHYKFWLDEDNPVEMVLADDTEYTATEFIFLKQYMLSQEIILIRYK